MTTLPVNLPHYNPLKRCVTTLIVNLLITILFSMVLFPEPEYGNNIQFDSPAEAVLVLVILGPLLETLVFQHYLLRGLLKVLRHAPAAAIIVALLFGLVHWYSVPYIVKASISGFLYNLLYLTLQQRGQPAFWYTAGTHACFNAIAFLHSLLAA